MISLFCHDFFSFCHVFNFCLRGILCISYGVKLLEFCIILRIFGVWKNFILKFHFTAQFEKFFKNYLYWLFCLIKISLSFSLYAILYYMAHKYVRISYFTCKLSGWEKHCLQISLNNYVIMSHAGSLSCLLILIVLLLHLLYHSIFICCT